MKFKKILTIGLSKDKLPDRYWQEIKGLTEELVSMPEDDPDFEKELAGADALLTNFGVVVTKEHIDKAPQLKYIGIMATAFGKVDIAYAKEKGIVVTNLGGYSTEAVAEFTIAAILEQVRGLSEGKSRALAGNYSEIDIKAAEVKGKVFAVLGLGNIGGRVAEIAQGFGADVRYWSRHHKPKFEEKSIKYQDIDSLLKEADFISVNLAETEETRDILNEQRMGSLKPNAVIISTVPMELVNMAALKNRLAKGDLTFIFDHSDDMEKEDVAALVQFKNCIAYPPIAYITSEAKANMQETFVGNIKNFLNGTPTNRVNG